VSVRKHWAMTKLTQLEMDKDTRQQLIEGILRQSHPKIALYAWDIAEGVAAKAFFTQTDALRDWYLSNRMWESSSVPTGIVVHTWKMNVEEILRHSTKGVLCEVPQNKTAKIDVVVFPSELQEDIQRSLKKQG
jgi:hypothetical protein